MIKTNGKLRNLDGVVFFLAVALVEGVTCPTLGFLGAVPFHNVVHTIIFCAVDYHKIIAGALDMWHL